MANVFPERLDKVNYDNLKGAVQQLEAYIRYMCERTDFAVTNVTKVAAKGGNVGADVVLAVQELQNDIGVMKSQMSNLTSSQTTIFNKLSDIEKRLAALEEPQT